MSSKFEPSRQFIKEIYFSPQTNYLIPKYQRPYSWEKANWAELMDTIENEGQSYIGTVIFNTDPDGFKGKEIIDGQQRYMTITILFAAIRDRLMELSKSLDDLKYRESANWIQGNIAKQDFSGRQNSFFLEPGSSIKKFFRDNIQTQDVAFYDNDEKAIIKSKPITKEEKRVINAYEYFKETLDDRGLTEKPIEIAEEIIDKLGELFVIRIEIDDYQMAFEIFESVNSKGEDLSAADLIKNQIFKHLQGNISLAEEKWLEFLENVESYEIGISTKEFIRYYWAGHYGYVSDKKLFKEINSTLKNDSGQWENLLDDFKSKSRLLGEILSNSVEDWKDHTTSLKDSRKIFSAIQTLKQLRGKTWTLLLLIIFSKNKDWLKKDIRIAKDVEKITNFSVLYFGIMGLPGNWYWRISYTYAKKFLNANEKEDVREIFRQLYGEFASKMMISQEAFEESFGKIKYSSASRPFINHLLSRIEESLHEKDSAGWNPEKVNIEHFLPQNPSKWGLTKTQVRPYLNDMGNMLLIPEVLNSKLGNKAYQEKIDLIKANTSDLKLMRELVDNCENGTWEFGENREGVENAIRQRGEILAKRAFQIWVNGLKAQLGY